MQVYVCEESGCTKEFAWPTPDKVALAALGHLREDHEQEINDEDGRALYEEIQTKCTEVDNWTQPEEPEAA